MIKWDSEEFFTAANGETGVRYAVSEGDGVYCDFSMHDDTVLLMLPPKLCQMVHDAPTSNAYFGVVDGRFVALFGFGVQSDPMGNLMMWRVKINHDEVDLDDPAMVDAVAGRYADIMTCIWATMDKFGMLKPKRSDVDALWQRFNKN